MVTFELSHQDVIEALTAYLFDTNQINEDTPDGIMSFNTRKDGTVHITISELLVLEE